MAINALYAGMKWADAISIINQVISKINELSSIFEGLTADGKIDYNLLANLPTISTIELKGALTPASLSLLSSADKSDILTSATSAAADKASEVTSAALETKADKNILAVSQQETDLGSMNLYTNDASGNLRRVSMETLLSLIKSNSATWHGENLAALQTAVTNLATQVTSLDGKETTNAGGVSSVVARVSALEADNTTNKASITDHASRLDQVQSTTIPAAVARIQTLEQDTDAATALAKATTIYNYFQGKLISSCTTEGVCASSQVDFLSIK
jgi:hypothetical protein